ncbi:aspartic peptidase domain-containing protein [Penicillium vulpinum]|uniref:Peptidase A1 domain-containing protein n=1 Tax=Penicillium vulpinum TaxID=29845 RepID=A0A1V6RVS1_9EURO|nr:aspartic peptidase domain-containing protein [Penicillium vulpinum]KAJ5971593.1 aspartic peptidase domain-containing protein [Penicillium vulpinum]OQE05503.1 hypothetical protein PENVUL_c024G10179 [Penicillium vulpinum]
MYFLFAFLVLCLAAIGYSHPSGPSASRPVSIPAFWTTYGYVFNITVGTPPQQLAVLSDWTWVSLFTRSGRCNDVYDVSRCVTEGQEYFDEKKSTTFKNTTLGSFTWPNTAFAPDFTVDYGRDSVCTGTLCTKRTILQLSDFPYDGDIIPIQEFGGIYGLAPVTPHADPRFVPHFYQAWKRGETSPRVGWNSCAKLSSSQPCLDGDAKYVFGGSDTTLYNQSELTWFRTKNTSYITATKSLYYPQPNDLWATRWTGGWIATQDGNWSRNYAVDFTNVGHDKKAITTTAMAILDEGSEGLGTALSADAYAQMVQMTSASPASNETIAAIRSQGTSSGTGTQQQPWYLVNCTNTAHFPSIVYELDGRANYTVGPEDYIQKLYATGECYLNINIWPYVDQKGNWKKGNSKVLLLGLGFLQKLYVVFDYEKSKFGLAPLKAQ